MFWRAAVRFCARPRLGAVYGGWQRAVVRPRGGRAAVPRLWCSSTTTAGSGDVLWRPPELLEGTKSLNVALVGAPNAGKSSILNAMLGEKVSAVSRKYNTTRHRVLGVCTRGRSQLIFYDTPGIVTQAETGRFFRPLVVSAAQSVPMADVVVFVVDVAKRWDGFARNTLREIVALCAHSGARLVVACNKADLLDRQSELLRNKVDGIVADWERYALEGGAPGPEDAADVAAARLADLRQEGPPDDWADITAVASNAHDRQPAASPSASRRGTLAQRLHSDDSDTWDDDVRDAAHGGEEGVPAPLHGTEQDRLLVWSADVPSLLLTSAVTPHGLQSLSESLFRMAVPRPWQFSASVATDLSERERVAEVIREQLFHTLNQEVPYLVRQENRSWQRQPNGALYVDQDILMPSKRHARMLTARGGEPLRKIAREATKDLERMFKCRVRLGLHVGVRARVQNER